MSAPIEVPVLIAGAGPVGATLALELAHRGIRSLLVERRLAMPPNPKCNTTNARSMEHFRRLGCADAIRRAGLPPDYPTDVVYATRWLGQELTRYRLRSSAQVLAGRDECGAIDAYWPTPEPQHRVSQLAMEPVLRDHLRTFPQCEYREGWRFVSHQAVPGGVECVIEHCADGRSQRLRCQYLVSCEGGQSSVRKTIGARLEGRDCIARFCTTYLRSAEITARWPHARAWMHRLYNADGESHLIAIDGRELWLHHSILPPDADLDAHDHHAAIRKSLGGELPYEVLGQERWQARAMVADRYRQDRVFLCGDAAHIWIPMGGFGMNAGVEDAVNLGWKLAAVLQGWAPDRLLDSYESERRAIGQLVAGSAAKIFEDLYRVPVQDPRLEAAGAAGDAFRAEVGRSITAHNLAEFDSIGMQLGVTYDQSPVIHHDGGRLPPFAINRYVESSVPGARAPHFWRAAGRALYDDLGAGFSLLCFGAVPENADALAAAFAARKVPLKLLQIDEPAAAAKFENYALVLVRPDQHIAWRAQRVPVDPQALVAAVTGAA
ncbi:MAG: FAD-dependent monooxygenase [Reyranella sp.]|nr:FAD-dependent monooxygenase [Reyranella sp.]